MMFEVYKFKRLNRKTAKNLVKLAEIRESIACSECENEDYCNIFDTMEESFLGCISTISKDKEFMWIYLNTRSNFINIIIMDGDSMLPTYQEGDVSISVSLKGANKLGWHPDVGDIVSANWFQRDKNIFRYKKNLLKNSFAHRIIEVSPEGFKTKGDNNPKPDPFILKLHHIQTIHIGRIRDNQLTFFRDDRTVGHLKWENFTGDEHDE